MFVSVRTKEYSGHATTWKQWATRFKATTWPKGVRVREDSGWSARGNKQSCFALGKLSLSLLACLSLLLSNLGEAGVREFAAEGPATERGNRVAEAAPREGQTGNRANDCWDPIITTVCWVFVQRKGRSQREMWQLGNEVGTNKTVRAGTNKFLRSLLEG